MKQKNSVKPLVEKKNSLQNNFSIPKLNNRDIHTYVDK